MKAMSIGCSGDRCYEVTGELAEKKKEISKVIGTCPKCRKDFFMTRMPKRDQLCKCAGRRFKQEEKIHWVMNGQIKQTVTNPIPKIPVAVSRGFQQFTKPSAVASGHTSFPDALLDQPVDSYKKMLNKFEQDFLALSVMMNETRDTFEKIVMKAKTTSSSWRTMNREVRKACDQYCSDNGLMTHKEFQEKFFYEGIMNGRTTWGKNAPWL